MFHGSLLSRALPYLAAGLVFRGFGKKARKKNGRIASNVPRKYQLQVIDI